MGNMINIAEILKDCPKGMELDCTMYNGVVTLEQVQPLHTYSIKIRVKCGDESFTNVLTEYGQTSPSPCNKCVIFPKGKTTWEGFQRLFKDGDVCTGKVNGNLVIFIYKERINTTLIKSHFVLYVRAGFCKNCCIALKDEEIKFATEEEKQRLFHVIKENGYRWDADTKTLRVVGKLGKLKFKVGDVVQDKEGNKVKITEVVHECVCYLYKTEIANEIGKIYFDKQNDWELVPNKFDITTLKPFDKVLVRDENGQKWMCDIFSYYDDKNPRYPFWGVGRSNSKQCIPYKGNEHLLGTTNDCDEFYKNW